MIKARNSFLEKKIPRGFGVLILLFSMGTIFYLSRNAVLFGTKAAADKSPKDLRISNITADSFTVSYITDEDITASVTYGKDAKLGQVAFDSRDGGKPASHSTHYITIPNLTPSTKYFYSITSGDQTFTNNSAPYEVITASSSAVKSNQAPINGKVSLEDGSAPPEAIVYVQTESEGGSQILSTLIKPDGSFTIPLSTLLKKDLSGSLPLTAQTQLKMNLVSPTLASNISFLASQTNPIPPVILSKDYDFSIDDKPLAKEPIASSSASGDFPVTENTTTASSVQLLIPKKDEEFEDRQPLFKGTASTESEVEIIIESNTPDGPDVLIATELADQNGNWEYRPNNPLEPGKNIVTIKASDTQGIIQTISRSFTVLAEGSQFTEPSVEPTKLPSPTLSIPTPTLSPTVAPTSTPSATPTTVASASPTLAPIISSQQATPVPNITTPPIPKSGSGALIFGLVGFSTLIGIGTMLFLLF